MARLSCSEEANVTEDRISFGIGLDMPWGVRGGFHRGPLGDTLDSSLANFCRRYGQDIQHVFLAFQPKDFRRFKADDYQEAFAAFYEAWPGQPTRVLHHTMLNLAGGLDYQREALLDFTNALVERFGIRWVNEDVGIWSLDGKSLPYPLPPILNQRSLDEVTWVARNAKDRLAVPLLLEFPGFTEGSSLILGTMHAFDFFRDLAEGSDALVTLDTGHLLSYLVLIGRHPDWSDLARLPLDRCFEIHLAGSELQNGRFRDMHHGVLLDEQLELLAWLAPRCPRLRAVTYEDPRFLDDGSLHPDTRASYQRLRGMMADLAEEAPC